MTKFKIGDIVWARLPGASLWNPAQVADPACGGDEAYCKQLPGHTLVCFYGYNKWSWLPPQRLVDFDTGYSDFAKLKGGKVWQQAVDEAREALSRSKGGKQNPPAQLQARHGNPPAAGSEVLYGIQQHPRAQALMMALQKGATNNIMHSTANSGAGNGSVGSRSSSRTAEGGSATGLSREPSSGAEGGGHTPKPSRASRESAKGGYSIPAWPEYLHESTATPADVHTVDASDALAWLRALARGSAPAVPMAPEQELSARQQLTSLDLARRQTAFAAMVEVTSSQIDPGAIPTSPRQPSRRSVKPMGLQPGTHSLSLPEDVARVLEPVSQLLQQEPQMAAAAAAATADVKNPDGTVTRRAPGGGNLLGSAVADLVLRVNGQVLPFTCAVTIQLVTSHTHNQAGTPTASPTAQQGSAPLVQFRVGGLHTVLQQVMPLPLPPPGAVQGAGAAAGAGDGKTLDSKTEKAEKEKQQVPGPAVEGWQALGPHQIMLSLAVPASLLQLTAPGRPPILMGGRISNSGSELSIPIPPSPRAASAPVHLAPPPPPPAQQHPARSPSAALLATYGVILPAMGPLRSPRAASLPSPRAGGSGAFKRPAGDSAGQLPDLPNQNGMATTGLHRPHAPPLKRVRVTSDGGTNGEQWTVHQNVPTLRSSQLPSPAAATATRNSTRVGGSSSQLPALSPRPAPPAKRPAWSSRVTPYDPSDPMSHPMLSNGSCKLKATASMTPISPTAEAASAAAAQRQLSRNTSGRETDGGGGSAAAVGSMGPPQPRAASGLGLPRRSGDSLYLGTLQPIQTGQGGLARVSESFQPQQDGGSPLAEDGQDGVAGAMRLAAALQGGGADGGENQADPERGGAKQQQGVLLVEIRAGNMSKVRHSNSSIALDRSKAGVGKATGGSGEGAGRGELQQTRVERGLVQLLHQLGPKGTAALGALGLQGVGVRSVGGPSATPLQRQASRLPSGGNQTPQPPQPLATTDELGNGSGRATAGPRPPSILTDLTSPRAPDPSHPQPTPSFLTHPTLTPSDSDGALKRPSWPAQPPQPPSNHPTAQSTPSELNEGAPLLQRISRPGSGERLAVGQAVDTAQGVQGIGGGGTRTEFAAVTPAPMPAAPTTPQLDTPFVRSQTPEGQHLQAVASQLAAAAEAVRGLSAGKHYPPGPLSPNTMEVLATLREKAAAVATRAMVGSLSPTALSSGDSQLRSEPLQHLLGAARETLAACDAAAATHIASHALQATAGRGTAGGAAAAAGAAGGSLLAYAGVAAAAAALLQLLGGAGDEEASSGDGEDSQASGERASSAQTRRLGALGGLEDSEIEALQQLAQPLAAAAPAAAAVLRLLGGPASTSPAMAPPSNRVAVDAGALQPAVGVAHDAHVMVSTCGAVGEAAGPGNACAAPHGQAGAAGGGAGAAMLGGVCMTALAMASRA